MQPEQAQLWVAIARGTHVPGECCYVHGRDTSWWKRGRDLICSLCHPNPATLVPPVALARNVKRAAPGKGKRAPAQVSYIRPQESRGSAINGASL